MLQKYSALQNQNIYDVCLMTYGDFSLLYKLMADNSFPGVDVYPNAGAIFVWDDTLVFDQSVSISNSLNAINYATRASATGGTYYKVVGEDTPPGYNPTPIVVPVAPPAPPATYNYPFSVFTTTPGLDNTPGDVTYTSSALVGLSNYPVQSTQVDNFMNLGSDITYNSTAGSFTIIIPGFYLLDGYQLNVFPSGLHL